MENSLCLCLAKMCHRDWIHNKHNNGQQIGLQVVNVKLNDYSAVDGCWACASAHIAQPREIGPQKETIYEY